MLNVFHYSLDILKSKLGASISMKYRGAFIHTNWVALRKYPSGGGGGFYGGGFYGGNVLSHSDRFSLRSVSVRIRAFTFTFRSLFT